MVVATLIFNKSLFSMGFTDCILLFKVSYQYFFKNLSMNNYIILINTNKLQDQKRDHKNVNILTYTIDMRCNSLL